MKRSAAAVLLCFVVLPLPAFAAPPPEDNLAAPLQAPGLFDTVHVRRYVHDIPHILAKNDRDALFALGWIHAEDRFFQMHLLRRTFSGTLAELVGKDALASDVQLRTVGLRRAAEASLPALSRSTGVWLESYACGVNAWLADTSHSLPAEYSPLELTRASIPVWTPGDTIVILKGVTFSLSFDLTNINRNVAPSAFQEAREAASFNGAAGLARLLPRSRLRYRAWRSRRTARTITVGTSSTASSSTIRWARRSARRAADLSIWRRACREWPAPAASAWWMPPWIPPGTTFARIA